MTHTEAFADFVARRDAARAELVRVTWRRVSPRTGGGYSGLGPGGQLCYVGARTSLGDYSYGQLIGKRRRVIGVAPSLAAAKASAAALLRPASELPRPIKANPHERSTTMANTATAPKATEGTAPAAEAPKKEKASETLLSALLGELKGVATLDKGSYVRIFRGNRSGPCVAWVHKRKNGLRVDARLHLDDLAADLQKKVEKASGSFGVRLPVTGEDGIPVAAAVLAQAIEASKKK